MVGEEVKKQAISHGSLGTVAWPCNPARCLGERKMRALYNPAPRLLTRVPQRNPHTYSGKPAHSSQQNHLY